MFCISTMSTAWASRSVANAACNPCGLEFVGTTLMGFENTSNKLDAVNVANGQSLGSSATVGMSDLGTIIFLPLATDPAAQPVSYD